ncbi:CHASE2 domain-containing protein [Phenylobacterium sp.]|uniref:CHASE2 domain-containing protein n=1 Tax=Phenylobacterium sp. TaxID=1871053 RepID=UPI0028A09904|nr:CHASE2 domain-containing protein [Phenylobacterium sp.]
MTRRAPIAKAAARRRVIAEWALVALAASALVAFLALSRATERADNVVFDTVSEWGVRAPHDDIVIVAIDNRSIAQLGRWPWPRARHHALLETLARARPKAIAYDVLMVEPEAVPGADEALARALAAASPVYLPLTFDVPGPDGAPYELLAPIAPLARAAAGLGQVNVDFDGDGVIRRAYMVERDGARAWPHLMAFMQAAASGLPAPVGAGAAAGPARAPLVREQPLLISFAGPPGHFRTISFVDVVNGATPAAFLQGKLVLVGATADGLGDRYATPLSNHTEIMSGVELQANLLDTLLTGKAISPAGPGKLLLFSLTPLALALAGFLLLRPRANLLLGGALLAMTLAASAVLLLQARVWAPPTAALAGLLLVYPLWSWRRLEATSAYMLQELRAFSREPDLLSALTQRPGGPPTDVIDRQVALMHAAIDRARDLRRQVLDALQGLPDATLVTALDGKVLIANREAEALFGGAGLDPANRPVAELLTALAPEAQPEDFIGSDAAGDLELTVEGGRSFAIRRTTLSEAGGAPVGWIVRFTDVTALKEAGRQRESILELLTHDMRSPQVSILTLLGGSEAQAIAGPLADRIAGYARRTLSLADNFVNLARAEADTYSLEIVDLGDVLLDAVDDLWPQSSAQRVSVTTSGADGEVLVEADRSHLTRALINLVDNAIKYSPAGGRVDCAVQVGEAGAICTIADQGEGMSPAQVANLFKRFQRARPKGGERIDGVGLGLSFVHAVVQRHGGRIDCASAPGQGSRFTITLPLAGG